MEKVINNTGFVPVIILVGVALAIIGGTLYFEKNGDLFIIEESKEEPRLISSPSPSISASSKPTASFKATVKPNATPTKSTPKPSTPSVQVTPTANTTNYSQSSYVTQGPSPTPTPAPRVVCQVCAEVSGGCSSSKSGTAPLTISFVYAASWYNTPSGSNDYVTNVQWDFNGDGSWDTAYDTANQHPAPYTYSQSGNYTPRMHLQTNNGLESDICTGNIVVNP